MLIHILRHPIQSISGVKRISSFLDNEDANEDQFFFVDITQKKYKSLFDVYNTTKNSIQLALKIIVR